jgi:hypothetical protein
MYIHGYTENLWDQYVDTIPKREINYLLIAEAPPWSKDGNPQYVLDHNSSSRSLLTALRKTFFQNNDSLIKPKDIIRSLAEIGFLIVDSIPFSMKYSRRRSSRHYKNLITKTAYSYMLKKLSSNKLYFSPELTIGFSLKLNALAVMAALQNRLHINRTSYVLGEELIGVNKANYPDATKLRSIFRVKDLGRITTG